MKQITLLMFLFFLQLLYSPLKAQEEIKNSVPPSSRILVLYFPWDKDALHTDYMSNGQVLQEIDRFFSNPILLSQMDSVVITATASPEGPPIYNQKLSERRLNTIIRFLRQKYPSL